MTLLLTANNHFLNEKSHKLFSFVFARVFPLSSTIENFFVVFHGVLKKKNESSMTDDECVRRMGLGEEQAFQELFDRYGSLVFGLCCRLLGDKAQAEDASQDVWVKVARSAHRFKAQGKCRAWLLQIARTTCLSSLRSQKKFIADDKLEEEVETFQPNEILQSIEKAEDKMKLKKIMNQLPDAQRVALVIWMTEEPSYEQLATQLGVSVSAVKSLLFRSKQTIRSLWGDKNA